MEGDMDNSIQTEDKKSLPSNPKNSNPNLEDQPIKKPRRPPVTFKEKEPENLDEPPPTKGNFEHFAKTKKFDYEDRYRGKDVFFYANVATECDTYFLGQRIRYREKKTEYFAFIVDLDAYEYHKVVFHSFLNEILQSAFFRFSILFLVVLNAAIIGMNTSAQMSEQFSLIFQIFDQVILSVFMFEILVKWVYDFRLFWKVWWNVMDFMIVFLIILASVLPALGRNGSVLVVIRVVRAFRSLRSVSFLSNLAIVSHTIVKSVIDMGNILSVLMIFMLVMSVMGVILFEIEDLDTERFLSAFDAWFVLFICVTQDGWNQVLEEFRPSKEWFALIAAYLIFAVGIGAFVFANLIVAVIVANLELSVKELREEKKLSINPLEVQDEVTSNELDISPVYDLLCKSNIVLLAQRPLRIPSLRKFSDRRIQAYINIIVALEQNMLEAEIIHIDMEKIMAVMLSVVLQLEMYSQQKGEMDEKLKTQKEVLEKAHRIDGALVKPVNINSMLDVKNQMASNEQLAMLQQIKNRNSADTFQDNHSELSQNSN